MPILKDIISYYFRKIKWKLILTHRRECNPCDIPPIRGGATILPQYVKAAAIAIALPAWVFGKCPALLNTVGMIVDVPAPTRITPNSLNKIS